PYGLTGNEPASILEAGGFQTVDYLPAPDGYSAEQNGPVLQISDPVTEQLDEATSSVPWSIAAEPQPRATNVPSTGNEFFDNLYLSAGLDFLIPDNLPTKTGISQESISKAAKRLGVEVNVIM